MIDGFTIFAWFVMAVIFLAAIAGVVALGLLPKKIARVRNHPHVDAINAASWIGLALGGIGWPIAFVWAFTQPKQDSPSSKHSR
jgi:ethanolamine transporter EutH